MKSRSFGVCGWPVLLWPGYRGERKRGPNPACWALDGCDWPHHFGGGPARLREAELPGLRAQAELGHEGNAPMAEPRRVRSRAGAVWIPCRVMACWSSRSGSQALLGYPCREALLLGRTYLQRLGYHQVLRCRNDQVLRDVEVVMESIGATLFEIRSPPPSRERELRGSTRRVCREASKRQLNVVCAVRTAPGAHGAPYVFSVNPPPRRPSAFLRPARASAQAPDRAR